MFIMTTPYQAATHHQQPPTATSLLLKPRDAAIALQLSARKLFDLTKSGEIVAVRIGRAVRYDPLDLAAYIAAHKGHRP
ncbi:MAG TPA: helix-turn-helix domain-containing protein [Phycisphaerales bacterium]|nr:helix-turn-helix domain-containing protein [Phycisphaerales bacterium]